jgi:hypothetical protein
MIITKLKELGFSDIEINNIILNSRNNIIIVNLLEIILKKDENKIIKELINLILENEPLKILSVNVKDLSKVTGLTIRKINKLRRENKIPCITLSGENNKAGRKTYLYQIDKVIEALKNMNTLKEQ